MPARAVRAGPHPAYGPRHDQPALARWPGSEARWRADFEVLTDHALAGRKTGRGAWAQFDMDVPDDALRPNLRVFLAGALEATTSLAAWTVSHLAHRPDLQAFIYYEVHDLDVYDPDNLDRCRMLNAAIQ